jgi:asparagine synthetase B (glutamine-hydrolysing)
LSQAEISALESGGGSRTSIETWVAIGVALRRPVAISFSRDGVQPLNDAGHLEAQELVLRLATAAGWAGAFEVPSRPDEPRHSSDLVLRRAGETVLVEIWNRLDDLGAAVRSTDRKVAELANDRLVECWLLVDTVANRAIVRRYPTILRSRFPESSAALVRAISQAAPLPRRSAAAWIDLRAAMLRPLRLHR